MKSIRVLNTILIIISFMIPHATAQVGLNKIAQSTMSFLLVNISPQASAMGEANNATGTGIESIFSNPAALVEMERSFEVKFFVTQWIADINYMAGAAAWNAGIYGTLGVSFLSVDYGTINGTQLLHSSESGSYPLGYKDTGPVDNVAAYTFGISYAKSISDQFFLGGSIRLAGQNLGQTYMTDNLKDNDATKLIFDAGVKYYTGLKSFRFGMTIRNFSSDLKREEIYEQLPMTFTLGAAMDILDLVYPEHDKDTNLLMAVDFVQPNNFSERFNFGLEYKFWQLIALRAGYQTNRDLASWSAGIGLDTDIGNNNIEFNYSYSNIDIFSGVNRFSVGFSF